MNIIFLFIALINLFSGTAYLWDQDRLVGEIRPEETIYYLYEPEGFVPIAQLRGEQIYYYHTDPLGTPEAMSDDQGRIVWQAKYGLFGAIEKYYVNKIDNPLRFQGQYFDRETGLHYNRYRYYHPTTGRFISQDPIGFEGGLNLYQYAPNPLNWVDPLGLMAKPGDCPPMGGPQTLEQRAADLVKRNNEKNRVSITHPSGRTNIDLQGKTHGNVPTPHVEEFKNNIIPRGPRVGEIGSRSKVGDTRPATAADLRIVDRFLKSQEK